MRRSVLIVLLAAAAALAAAVLLQVLGHRTTSAYYVQHLSQPSEQSLGPVTGTGDELVTHLPILRVDTGGAPIPFVRHDGTPMDDLPRGTPLETACTVEAISREGVWHRESDRPDLSADGVIRIRGNSSRYFDKKPYLIRFTDSKGEGENHPLLGMSSASEWILHGPFLDRTLMRNYLCYYTAGQVMPYAPDTRYCEFFLNGEYLGVYLLTEAITKGEGRVELTEPGRNSPITSWLIRWDRADKGDTLLDNFALYTWRGGVSAMDLRYPGKNTITPERLRYASAEISQIEREIYATGTSDKVDVTAFAQYFVLNEFFGNVDAGRFSTFYYKDLRGKVTPVVWDFNNGCDNYIDYVYDESGFYMTDAPWFSGLLRDRDFVHTVITQYRAMRRSVLSDEALSSFLDETSDWLGTAVDRNYEKWGYVFEATQADDVNYLHPFSRNYHSYEESVDQLKDWLSARGAWLDRNIDGLQQYCHPSKLAGLAE